MSKVIYTIHLILFYSIISYSQDFKRYTFCEDYKVANEKDLIGYTFVPYKGKMSTAHYSNVVKEGVVSFTVLKTTVLIDERAKFTPAGIDPTPTDAKPYKLHIARLSRTSFGYDIQLINEKNRDLIGHLKIYINGYSHPILLKFRPSMNDPEHIYEIRPTPKKQLTLDNKFYSHETDFSVESIEDFDNAIIYPFLQIENFGTEFKKIDRIYSKDRIIVKFEERMVMRGKKEKSVRHIVFINGDKEQAFSIKRGRETSMYVDNKFEKVYEISLKEESTDTDYFVIMHRGVKSKLKALELVKGKEKVRMLYYAMRDGNRLVE